MWAYLIMLLQTASAPLGAWTYSSNYDQMRETSTQIAGIEATNQARLGAPFRGITRATLVVSKHNEASLVQIFIENGVISCGECVVLVKLDDQPASYWSASSNESASSLFIDAPWNGKSRAFDAAGEIGKARKIQVEVPFYAKGNFQYVFKTSSNLTWPMK